MKGARTFISRCINNPNAPMQALIIVMILVGMVTFQDYGQSWDEPLYYQYADAVPYAYSLQARLAGNFQIEKAYGPSAEDHKMYGPPYLLVARIIVKGLAWFTPAGEVERWHLVNFLTFQVGVIFLYLLGKRWLHPWAACAAAMLYATQPVLWGQAFINPKDSPFVALFILAIYSSFKMVDVLSTTGPLAAPTQASENEIRAAWPAIKKTFSILGILSLILLVLLIGLSSVITQLLAGMVQLFYHAEPASLAGRIFSQIAPNAGSIPVEAYIQKGLALFARLQKATLWLGIPLVLAFGLARLFPGRVLDFLLWWESGPLGPLPRLPEFKKNWRIASLRPALVPTLLAGVVLGIVTAMRVIGPLAALLALMFFLLRAERRSISGWLPFGLAAVVVTYIVWPFLWEAPLRNFLLAVQHMSANPKYIPVLFNGKVVGSTELPWTYLPVLLGITLSETVWPMFLLGLVLSGFRIWRQRLDWRSFLPLLVWFFVPFFYVIFRKPPMYDGYRHFLFILPPIFIVCGILFQEIYERLHRPALRTFLVACLVLPGLLGLVRSHPYQYAYYNAFIGGFSGAFRRFETDYWLTCYKEIINQMNQEAQPGTTLFVHRQPAIAAYYASSNLNIQRFDPDADTSFPGSLLLLTTRSNTDLTIHTTDPEAYQVGRDSAIFCVVRTVK